MERAQKLVFYQKQQDKKEDKELQKKRNVEEKLKKKISKSVKSIVLKLKNKNILFGKIIVDINPNRYDCICSVYAKNQYGCNAIMFYIDHHKWNWESCEGDNERHFKGIEIHFNDRNYFNDRNIINYSQVIVIAFDSDTFNKATINSGSKELEDWLVGYIAGLL